MSMIYIIVAYGGQYDAAWESNLFARYTSDDAERAVAELKELDARIELAKPRLVKQFLELQIKFPLVLEKLPTAPKGPAKSNKQNLAANEKVQAEHFIAHQRVWCANGEKQNLWDQEMSNYQRAFAKNECGLSDADLMVINFPTISSYCFGDVSEYRIDELEIL